MTLMDTLHDFRERFNTNNRAHKLVQKWNRIVLLESLDTKRNYTMHIENERMIDVQTRTTDYAAPETEKVVHLQGEESVLGQIFSGKYNPATAVTDGALAVFSDPKDKVKLEALAMVIWRLG